MRAIVAALVLVACGGAPRPTPTPHPLTRPTSVPVASASAAPASVDPLASFETIGKESLEAWPGTREVGRQEGAAKDGLKVTITASSDTCARAFVRATGVVSASMTNGTTTLSESKGDAIVLASKGPICVRKGETLTITVQGDARARLLVRQAP